MGRPVAFHRQYLCIARDDASTVFKDEWIRKAFQKGKGLSFIRDLDQLRGETFRQIVCSIDLATSRKNSRKKRKKQTDETVFKIIGERENGDRRLMWSESGRYVGPDIIDKIVELYRRFRCIFWVEINAAQIFIAQFAMVAAECPPIQCFETTSANKLHPDFGVESLATEMNNERWIFPEHGDRQQKHEMSQLCEDLATYHPDSHTGDHLMALWIGREGIVFGRMGVTQESGNLLRR